MHVTEKLRKLRERAGLSMAEVARLLEYRTTSGYQRYENATEFSKPYLPLALVEKLTQILPGKGTPPVQMMEVLGLAGIPDVVVQSTAEGLLATNAKSVHAPRLIPIITLDQMDTLSEDNQRNSPSARFTMAGEEASRDAFCLEVPDNSMRADGPSKFSFEELDRVVCDPNAEVKPGDFVIAKRDQDKTAVFRQYKLRDYDASGAPIVDLIPLNSHYPTLTISADAPGRIIARVIEHRKSL